MQKKLIAIAIVAAISSPAFADVSVYGVLDAGYGATNKTLTSSAGVDTKSGVAAVAFSTQTSSRLGVVFTEVMAGGMKSSVKIETGIGSTQLAGSQAAAPMPSNGSTIDATSLGSRELMLGLDFGQGTAIKAGYGSTLVRDISLGYDAAPGGNLVGNLLNNDTTLASNRVGGVAVSQAYGTVTATAQISSHTNTNDGVADIQSANGYLVGVQYASGPISAAVAIQNLKSTTNGTAAVTATGIYAGAAPISGTNPGVVGAAAVAGTDKTTAVTILGGSYDIGVAKIIAEYASIKVDDNLGGTSLSRSAESIGVQAPLGAVLAFAQVSMGSKDVSTAHTGVSESGMTIGAKYNLNKTTYGYASYGNTKLDDVAGAGTGNKVDQVAIGLVKAF